MVYLHLAAPPRPLPMAPAGSCPARRGPGDPSSSLPDQAEAVRPGTAPWRPAQESPGQCLGQRRASSEPRPHRSLPAHGPVPPMPRRTGRALAGGHCWGRGPREAKSAAQLSPRASEVANLEPVRMGEADKSPVEARRRNELRVSVRRPWPCASAVATQAHGAGHSRWDGPRTFLQPLRVSLPRLRAPQERRMLANPKAAPCPGRGTAAVRPGAAGRADLRARTRSSGSLAAPPPRTRTRARAAAPPCP